jgi:hypothetical protein
MKTDNEYFAEYLGWKLCLADECIKTPHYFDNDRNSIYVQDLNFKTWSALMPVVEKITMHRYLDCETVYTAQFQIMNMEDKTFIAQFKGKRIFQADTLLDATYAAALDFIKTDFVS